ncbi:unnamed protein product [Nyctereutes procyonoides]|uniref:(raccoon dog) hypothetical protein n=1 Tax=Nyctereutes procyonoides TaxID=34880 RepID=A0A811ZSG5_NYCPR|nr:unnamed protein product [Nyctereutes procyonoides]
MTKVIQFTCSPDLVRSAKNHSWRDTWVAQWLSICLWLRFQRKHISEPDCVSHANPALPAPHACFPWQVCTLFPTAMNFSQQSSHSKYCKIHIPSAICNYSRIMKFPCGPNLSPTHQEAACGKKMKPDEEQRLQRGWNRKVKRAWFLKNLLRLMPALECLFVGFFFFFFFFF